MTNDALEYFKKKLDFMADQNGIGMDTDDLDKYPHVVVAVHHLKKLVDNLTARHQHCRDAVTTIEFVKWEKDGVRLKTPHHEFIVTIPRTDVINQYKAALAPVDVEGLKKPVNDGVFIRCAQNFNMGYNQAIDDLAARGFGVPEGYALVPIEPTDKILNAMAEQCDGYNENYYFDIYEAMIKAAPKKED